MKIPFDLDGKTVHISFKELCARLWPFGQWSVVWWHVIDGESVSKKKSSKKNAVGCYQAYKNIATTNVVRIRKEGGWFHGIEYKPRTGKKT